MSSLGTMDHKCEACGAVLKFNPHGQNWACEYCKNVYTKEQIDAYEAKRGVEELTKDTEAVKLETNAEGMDIYSCPNCGAEIIADENTSATFCVYCKNTAILKNKLIGEFNPSKIIPFRNTLEDAKNAFKSITKGKPLAPKEFTSNANIEQIKGIYIPFWLYDYTVSADIVADAKRITSWSDGSYRYTKTDTYLAKRSGNMDFYRIPVDGSTRFDNEIMNSIEPFDYNYLTDFSHSYLSGFLAEKYDVDANGAMSEATTRVVNSATEELKKDIVGYSTVIVTGQTNNPNMTKNEYVLLPVWLLNVKYNNKMYTFAMNGQTGKMIGDIPVDKKKVVIYSVGIFIALMVILSLIWFII